MRRVKLVVILLCQLLIVTPLFAQFSNPLVGVWSRSSEDDGDTTLFFDENNYQLITKKPGEEQEIERGTYSYTAKTVTLYLGGGEFVIMGYRISKDGNQLIFLFYNTETVYTRLQ